MNYTQKQTQLSNTFNSCPKPLVSVLIPSYNHEAYILECLESIKSSNYPNIELILLDDGSVDKTYSIAQNWIDKNKACFTRASYTSQSNVGVCATLNRLISSSTGEYVCSLASDDQLLSNGINALINLAIKTQSDIILSDAELIDEKGELIASSALEHFGKSSKLLEARLALHLDILLEWNPPYAHQLIRRSFLDRCGLYDIDFVIEDLDMCLRAMFHGKLSLLPQRTWRYRYRAENVVTPGLNKVEILSSTGRIIEKHLRYAKGIERLVLITIIQANCKTAPVSSFKVKLAQFARKLIRLTLKIGKRLY